MKHCSSANLRGLALLNFFSLVGSVSAQNAAPRYNLVDLGALSTYPYSRAYGINNKGQVVGQVAQLKPKLETHAVLWDGGKSQIIAAPEGLPYPVARAINDTGLLVGGCEIQNYGSYGFNFMGLKDQAYSWQNGKLDVLADDSSHAYAINNRGQVVGESGNNAVLWSEGKSTTLATLPDYSRNCAYAINKVGQITGITFDKEGKRLAALWSEGKMQLLGTLPGDDQSLANAINDAGRIVGSSGHGNSYSNLPFIWEKGKMDTLTPLDGRTTYNEVLGINNRDQIVGCGLKDGLYMHAVLWENKFPKDLNDLIAPNSGLTLMKAFAINDQGQIVGEARDDKVQIHAFLLNPVAATATQKP